VIKEVLIATNLIEKLVMSRKPEARPSAVSAAAASLRRDVLNMEDGELLGSEDDLIARYGVSRPTLRQAAALISQENLLKVKRGVGGGYFARQPSTRAVAHMAAIYLRSRRTEVREIIEAVAPIRIALARLASNNGDKKLLASLKRFLETERQQGPDQRFKDFVKAEREFGRLLGELGDNRVIALFMETLYDFSSMLSVDEDIYVKNPERVSDYRIRRNQLAEAILEQDEELAAVAARRCSMITADWYSEGLGGKRGSMLLEVFGMNEGMPAKHNA
jgi:DNA-binding FadR family transcriptional regulator